MDQSEAVQGALDAGIGLVAAAQFVAGQQVCVGGEQCRVGFGGAVGHALLHPAQLGLDGPQWGEGAVDDLLHGQLPGQLLFLGEVPDASVCTDGDPAPVRALDTSEQAEQGRLAGAVLADDADPAAGREGAADGVEDGAALVGLGDVKRGELCGGCGHTCTPGHGRRGGRAARAVDGMRMNIVTP